jgi:hypothetical protein
MRQRITFVSAHSQDLVSCGIGGALAAGYMTACAMDMRVLVKNAYKMVLL